MKRVIAFLIALAIPVGLYALNASVNVTTTAAKLMTPGPLVKTIVIQNPAGSTGTINVSLDGTQPTSTTGIAITSGTQLVLNYTGAPSGSVHVVNAIAVTGNTTINVSTDDTQSTAP